MRLWAAAVSSRRQDSRNIPNAKKKKRKPYAAFLMFPSPFALTVSVDNDIWRCHKNAINRTRPVRRNANRKKARWSCSCAHYQIDEKKKNVEWRDETMKIVEFSVTPQYTNKYLLLALYVIRYTMCITCVRTIRLRTQTHKRIQWALNRKCTPSKNASTKTVNGRISVCFQFEPCSSYRLRIVLWKWMKNSSACQYIRWYTEDEQRHQCHHQNWINK